MKHQLKQLAALALAGALALSLVACGSADSAPADSASTADPAESAPAFDYSSAMEDSGKWKGIDALSYVTLPEDYMSITLSEEARTVTDEQMDQMVDALMENSSNEYTEINDRAVEDGDLVNIDYVGTVDGVEFSGGNTNGAGTLVTAGSPEYIDDFLTQIIGHKPGETVDVVVTFPSDYRDSTDPEGNPMVLKDKEAVFKTTINYIRGDKIIPELNDEFVTQHFGPEAAPDLGFTTVDELKNGLREDRLNTQKYDFVRSYLLEKSTISEIPAAMTEHIGQAALADLGMQAAAYGLDVNAFLEMQGVTEAEFLENISGNVEETAKFYLILQAVAEDQDIEVTEEGVRADLGEEYDQIIAIYGLGYTNQIMLTNEALTVVLDKAA